LNITAFWDSIGLKLTFQHLGNK